ncbi:translation initiation factor IF-2 [Rhodohalobacter barkolensis]|uniref:Translation initiation factor IF-2 n=1 Tax=Rhodohalobacter barkolensis TaxID=2053187 RepID=A0A2N0VJR6_9BACT|nr:translation initiation factor IF-2 [Rhodohalobacter barkolensis]PKD44398.1 translation initiation factor IF-2 [Rhodohalobacter barkolensis]
MTDQKPKKLFKVASEFNVATQSIVDTLSDNGFDVANRPNSKITPEMYEVLDGVYGDDKAKSREHERAREEYESRRNQILSSRNESVSIDNFLEPIDEKEEAKEEKKEEKPKEEKKAESSKEPTLEPQEEPEVKEEKEEEPEAASEEVSDEEKEKEIEVKSSDQETEESDDEEEKVKPEEVKKEAPKKEEPEPESDEEDEEDEEEDYDEDDEEEEDEDDTEVEDIEDEEDDDDSDSEEEEDSDEDDEEEIIRGRSNKKLTGTKVVGKVEFSKEPRKKRKTRKRKKDRKDDETSDAKKQSKPPKEDKSSKKSKKSKKKGRRSKVDEEDVEKKMRETMQKMQSSGTVGSKRSKRRRQRKEEREEERAMQEEMEQLEEQILEVAEFITVSDLAEELEVKPTDVITTCMNLGMMVSINQRLDASTIELVAAEYDFDVEFVDAEEMIEEEIEVEEDKPEDLEPRAPIITVMGHVDHGKTSLLDYIRKAKVAAGEAGGITQHVGAYEVVTDDDKKITFLDTPGHEAFTAMRSRGAQATDIVILVVAADDAVMPQTIEAINHAKAAGVSIVVAINKMDKPEANPDKIKQQLSEHGVIVEEYGGTNQVALVSAETGDGIDDLLEKVLIEAELLELKANPNRLAQGIVLESRIDKGKGTVANILVQNGTLKVGDPFVAGPVFGRVRAMENEHGTRLQDAGPSTPVQLIGFDGTPQAGDRLIVPKDEKTAKEVANQRQQIRREQSLRRVKHMTLDDLSRRMALGEVSELNIIIKADVDGSIEALSGALQKLSTEEVSVNIIHTGSGAITESDVLLASASDGIIIGFQVRPTAGARKLAETESIDIRLFSVIYDAVDEVHDALEGMLSPEISEQMKAMVTVREVFKVSKVGTIAGCYVTEGKLNRNNPIRVIRDGVVIYDGEVDSLKRFKDDVKEVQAGYECGVSIKNFNDLKVGDEFESYEIVEEKRSLDDAR